MSVLRCICSKADMLLVRFYEEADSGRALRNPIQSKSGRDAREVSLSLFLFCLPFHFYYCIYCLHNMWCDSPTYCHLPTHQPLQLLGWHTIDIFAIPSASRNVHNVTIPAWWLIFDGHSLIFVATSLVVLHHSQYNLNAQAWVHLSGASPIYIFCL